MCLGLILLKSIAYRNRYPTKRFYLCCLIQLWFYILFPLPRQSISLLTSKLFVKIQIKHSEKSASLLGNNSIRWTILLEYFEHFAVSHLDEVNVTHLSFQNGLFVFPYLSI